MGVSVLVTIRNTRNKNVATYHNTTCGNQLEALNWATMCCIDHNSYNTDAAAWNNVTVTINRNSELVEDNESADVIRLEPRGSKKSA